MGLTRIRAQQISDIDYKQACRAVLTTNVNLTGGTPASVDGVSLQLNDRVLVTGQSTASENGFYRVQVLGQGENGTWVRTNDTNETGEIAPGMIVMVTEGETYGDTQWKLTTNGTIVVGETELNFVLNAVSVIGGQNTQIQYNSGGVLTGSPNLTFANNALTVVGNVITGNILTDGYYYANGEPFVAGSNYGNANVLSYLSAFPGNITPAANVTYNLGSPENQWHSVYVGPGSLYVNGKKVLEDDSGRITVTTSENQNLAIKTTGTGDIELFADGTGVINLQGNVLADSGVSLAGTGGLKITSNLNLDSNHINNLDDPVQAQDAATKAYVDQKTANVSGSYSDANVATFLSTAFGSNTITTTGNITAGNFSGDGSQITNVAAGTANIANVAYSVAAANVSGTVANAAYAETAGAAASATTAVTVTDAAQPNITSVGTLSTVTVTGNVTGGNLITSGTVTAIGNIEAAYFIGNGSQLTGISASGGGGTVTVANTAPVSPNSGDIWIDSDSGIQYLYFSDGDSNQWAEMEAATSISIGAVDLSAVTQDITPAATATYSLGNATNRWANLYLEGNTIDLGGVQIKSDAESGALAFVPAVTESQPNPVATVISATGGITTAATDGGEISSNTIAAAATDTSDALLVMPTQITSNVTIQGNTNALSIGPISQTANTVITITTGQRWIIL